MSINQYTWRQEQQMLCDSFARRLLVEHNIKEVTTQKQAINGTREFEFPVPARRRYYNGKLQYSKERLRLAVFKSGYVRNQNSCSSNYQLNPKYEREDRWVWMYEDTGRTYVRRGMAWARALIYSELTRMQYMLEFYLRNYKKNTNKVG